MQVSLAGLGGNNFGGKLNQKETTAVVNAALDEGVTFIDTAAMYNEGRAEECLGRALGSRRQDVILTTKFGYVEPGDGRTLGGSRANIQTELQASLRRLGTDYIDLYQMHRPDPRTPIEETLRALDDLVRGGEVRYLGTSGFGGWGIADAEWTARDGQLNRFISAQNQWSLLQRGIEKEVAPACASYGVGIIPFFPLASGFLTGKYQRDAPMASDSRLAEWAEHRDPQPAALHDLHAKSAATITSEANFDTLERLTRFAEERGHTILELALSWLASSPTVCSIIAGATSVEQIRSNVAATQAWQLDADEMAGVDAALRGEGRTER